MERREREERRSPSGGWGAGFVIGVASKTLEANVVAGGKEKKKSGIGGGLTVACTGARLVSRSQRPGVQLPHAFADAQSRRLAWAKMGRGITIRGAGEELWCWVLGAWGGELGSTAAAAAAERRRTRKLQKKRKSCFFGTSAPAEWPGPGTESPMATRIEPSAAARTCRIQKARSKRSFLLRILRLLRSKDQSRFVDEKSKRSSDRRCKHSAPRPRLESAGAARARRGSTGSDICRGNRSCTHDAPYVLMPVQ